MQNHASGNYNYTSPPSEGSDYISHPVQPRTRSIIVRQQMMYGREMVRRSKLQPL